MNNIFFCFIGKSVPQALVLDDVWFGGELSKHVKDLNWRSFSRSGSNSKRSDRANLFYPIFIYNDKGKVHSYGESYYGNDRSEINPPNGTIAVWPLHKDGTEGYWMYEQEGLKHLISQGYFHVGGLTNNGRALYYLNKGEQKKIQKGVFKIVGINETDGSIQTETQIQSQRAIAPTSWRIPSHNARTGGTELLKKIYGNRFEFPKSIYAVHDALRFFVANKPNALILDFFSGSGTTLHAVNLLNKEDGGHRRCIMVTNNEVSAEEEIAFRARGLHKGDEEWEKYGIARYVNWPRSKCSIEGKDVNGQPLQGEYITSNTQEKKLKRAVKQLSFDIPDGSEGLKVKKQIVALINDKNMPQKSVVTECPFIVKEDATTAILFDINSIDEFFEEIHEDIQTIYIVTTNNQAFNAAKRELDELPEITKTIPVTIPMSEGFEANAAFYKLTFLDKEAVSLGSQLDKLLSILWMKAGAHGVCPTHVEGEYTVFPENRMAILIDEYGFDELKKELEQHPEIDTVYIIDDSEDNYRALAAQLSVKNTYQLYRDYLDNFKINIERR